MSMIELVITLGLLELELFELVRKLYCKRVILHDVTIGTKLIVNVDFHTIQTLL